MTPALALWAVIDADGRIVTHGHCAPSDAFLQTLPDGCTFLARPDHVTAFERWRFQDETWTLEDDP